jgi:transcriptional regulator with XRE-family HTH domain
MTQKEFADYLHVPFRSIQNWEGGQRSAPDYVVELIEYKLIMEGIIMTKTFLEKNATLIEEYDRYDGSIYLGTNYYYLYQDILYVSIYHDNRNRYTGESNTGILVDNVKKALNEYNKLYFLNIGLSDEGYETLKVSI